MSGPMSWGASGDSFFEYLLKCWIYSGKQKGHLLTLFDSAVTGMERSQVRTSGKSNLKWIDTGGSSMEHLACFAPGLLALGAYQRPEHPRSDTDLALAEELAFTCYQMYERMATGISPEAVTFRGGGQDFLAKKPGQMWNILRPESVETFWILHEITGDPKYRLWGRRVFESFNKHCRSRYGFGAHPDVTSSSRRCCTGNDDKQESFWLAETLKYIYLLMDPDHKISLADYVFNTEAHPLPISAHRIS